MGKLAYLFPGQGRGSIRVGMGKQLFWNSKEAAYIFASANTWLENESITSVCFFGPEEKLRRTVYSQPASFLVNLTSCAARIELEEQGASFGLIPRGVQPDYLAGHSVGYVAALLYSGALDFWEAMKIIEVRASSMVESCVLIPGKMFVLLDPNIPEVELICKKHGIVIGLDNSKTQIVLSGRKDAVEKAVQEIISGKFAKKILSAGTEGGFHSECMKPAEEAVKRILGYIPISDPRIPIIGNSRAQLITTAKEAREELVNQICEPVLWRDTINYLLDLGVDTFLEMGEGKVLSSNINRDFKGTDIVAVSFGALFADYLLLKSSNPRP